MFRINYRSLHYNDRFSFEEGEKSCSRQSRRLETGIVQMQRGLDYDLGFWILNFCYAENGLGGFLGPHWKVFHHGTLNKYFQGVSIPFGSWPDSEKGIFLR